MTALVQWDHLLFRMVNDWQGEPWRDAIFRWGTELGAAYVAIPLGIVLVTLSRVPGLMMWRALAVGTVPSLLASSLKLVFERQRPLATLEGVHVLGPPIYSMSFPSGHSITAFAMAGVLLALDRRLGLLWLPVAFFVALSRVYVGAHFPSDVIAGAALGFIPSYALARRVLRT
jgi:undecaprenyl-diphosphatase